MRSGARGEEGKAPPQATRTAPRTRARTRPAPASSGHAPPDELHRARVPLPPCVALMNIPASWTSAAPATGTVATVRHVAPPSVEQAPVNAPPARESRSSTGALTPVMRW